CSPSERIGVANSTVRRSMSLSNIALTPSATSLEETAPNRRPFWPARSAMTTGFDSSDAFRACASSMFAMARLPRAIANIEEAQALKASLESKPVVIAERAGQNGRLFGAVSSKEVAEGVKAMFDKDIDRRTVEFATPIRSLGEH